MKRITLVILAFTFSMFSIAQITVTGIVSNDSIPLESANVIIKNSTKGVATNQKGEFNIKAEEGDTLSISYLGYETKEFVVSSNQALKVQLKEYSHLDEVIVMASNYHSCWSTGCGICITYETYRNYNSEKNKLFPNPSSNGIFQLKLIEDYHEVKISIADMSGQLILKSKHHEFGNNIRIDLSEFPNGVYIVNIIADGKRLECIKAIIS